MMIMLSVHLSVTLHKRCILQQVSELVNRKDRPRAQFYNFQPPTPTLSSQAPHVLYHRHCKIHGAPAHQAHKTVQLLSEQTCLTSRVRMIDTKKGTQQYWALAIPIPSTNTDTCVKHSNDHEKIPKLYDHDNDCV